MNKFLLGVGTTILIALIAWGAYYFGANKNADLTIAPPESADSSPTNPTPTNNSPQKPTVVEEKQKSNTEITNLVVAALKLQSYEDLFPYLADSVQVRLESSGCCGSLSPAETISQLSYLDGADSPWIFDQSNSIITQLATASIYYDDPYIVGIAANKMGISFKLNDLGKIDAINLMATYELLLP